MDARRFTYSVPSCVMLLLLGSPAFAHEADLGGPHTHRDLTAVITKIDSGLLYLDVQGAPGEQLRSRFVSVNKAERMGVHEAKVGDVVIVTLGEGNEILDIHDASGPIHGHRLVVGNIAYAEGQFRGVVEITTSEGVESFAVDPVARSKMSGLTEGALVRAELDEANVLIDIHPYHE